MTREFGEVSIVMVVRVPVERTFSRHNDDNGQDHYDFRLLKSKVKRICKWEIEDRFEDTDTGEHEDTWFSNKEEGQ